MSTSSSLLHIDASPRGERSHSRRLGADFVNAWKAANPSGQVVSRDLGHNPVPLVTEAWVEGAFTAPAGHSAGAREAIAVSDALVDELLAVDDLVITTPIFNFSIPASLKAWIDQISRFGRTFGANAAGGFEGLARTRRVTVIVASGSDFRLTSAYGSANFVEPYLRAIFGFIGITNVTFIYAHSLNDGNPLRESSLAEAQIAARELAAAV